MTSTTHTDEIVSALNTLIRAAHDSEQGYRTAADAIDDDELDTVLGRYAQQRARYAAELEQESRTYGGEDVPEGSVGGSLRSGWINLKSAIMGGGASAILKECERADESTLETYEDVLQDRDMPDYLKEMIRQQHDEIRETLQHIRALQQARR